MPSPPTNTGEFIEQVRKSGLIRDGTPRRLATDSPNEQDARADGLVRVGSPTTCQTQQLLSRRRLVLGKYRMVRQLGAGGMGVVYLAEHIELEHKVAIKVMKDEWSKADQALERFFREARATAALDHPNIVRLHGIDHSDGTHFLVMEYVSGSDLQALLERTGPFDCALAVRSISQAAAGLQHAHEKGFVHRDIKPANLILAEEGTVKVLDLGLARSVQNPRDALTEQLEEGMILGSADYLSPEQALAAPFDARSDIYSLGATLFTLLTGRPPYEGTTAEKLRQHQSAPPRDIRAIRPDVPSGLNAVVTRMMAKRPDDRYSTARDVIAALALWLSEAGTGTCVASTPAVGSNQITTVLQAPPAR